MALRATTTQCTQLANDKCNTHLTRGELIGLVFMVEGGLLSITAVLWLLLVVAVRTSRYMQQFPEARWRNLIKTPIEIYVLSLFLADFIHGVGSALGVRWLAQGVVESFYVHKGVLLQGGSSVVALSTLAIAVHTFSIVFLKKGASSINLAVVVVGMVWFYIILFIGISVGIHSKPDDLFYSPTPYWCFVSSQFTFERVIGEYAWLWLTALVSLLLYVLLFFFLRGNLVYNDKSWKKLDFRRIGQHKFLLEGYSAAKDAFIMLLYPISYIGLIMGLSIVRWIDFIPQDHDPQRPDKHTVPVAVTFLAQGIFALSGVVNIILLAYTRPALLTVEPLYPRGVQETKPRETFD
ncbi:hypothetical protein BU17DRAFT_91948 [Hysterangium stoloniferum]|nr:hypothetical protein BU17DRAFT_91948 [Hysterangium stoloniferum]